MKTLPVAAELVHENTEMGERRTDGQTLRNTQTTYNIIIKL
jgi:hypothetical protein